MDARLNPDRYAVRGNSLIRAIVLCGSLVMVLLWAVFATAISGNTVGAAATIPSTQAQVVPLGGPTPCSFAEVPSPNQGNGNNSLQGTTALEGYYERIDVGSSVNDGIYEPLAIYWDEGGPSIMPMPDIPGGRLNAVDAVGPDDVWAVGKVMTETLILHYNGTSWSQFPSPNPGANSNELFDVVAIAANDVWAVGAYRSSATTYQALTVRWNGTDWSAITNLNISDSWLYGVDASASDNVWAVGDVRDGGPPQAYATKWNGSVWTSSPVPSFGTNFSSLKSVSVVGPSEVVAVGEGTTGSQTQNFVVRLSLGVWSRDTVPNLGPVINGLERIRKIDNDNLITVGNYLSSGTNQPSVLIYNSPLDKWFALGMAAAKGKTAWDLQRSFSPRRESLTGTSPLAEYRLVIVGEQQDSNGNRESANGNSTQTLVMESDCDTGTPGPTSTPGAATATSTPTSAPPTATPTACTVGEYSDVPPGSTFYPYINCLGRLGVISGYSDCSFRPANPVTRGQISKIVSSAAGFNDPPTGQAFEDIPPGHTYYSVTWNLAERNIISGYRCGAVLPPEPCGANELPYFRPGMNITRAQLTKIVSEAAGYGDPQPNQVFEDVVPGSTFHEFIARLYVRGHIGGYPCGTPPAGPCGPSNLPYFLQANNTTRGQAAKIVANTFSPGCSQLTPTPIPRK